MVGTLDGVVSEGSQRHVNTCGLRKRERCRCLIKVDGHALESMKSYLGRALYLRLVFPVTLALPVRMKPVAGKDSTTSAKLPYTTFLIRVFRSSLGSRPSNCVLTDTCVDKKRSYVVSA